MPILLGYDARLIQKVSNSTPRGRQRPLKFDILHSCVDHQMLLIVASSVCPLVVTCHICTHYHLVYDIKDSIQR